MTYCDSSFLASLYVTSDVFNPQARKEASKFTSAIPYTLLNELELLNALQRGLGDRSLTQAAHDAVIREPATDEGDGLLERTSLNQIKLYEKARELSRKHTSTLACRCLDILHVAAAVVLGNERFASFDLRQRKLAEAAGLILLPRSLPAITK
jgi:predicted nucleic acid-binding protein